MKSQRQTKDHTVRMRDVIETYDRNLFIPMKTGVDVLDEFWSSKNGIMPSTITMVVGDAGVGKTTMLMVILSYLQENGYNCLFISAEMDQIDFADYCFRFERFRNVPMLFPEYDGPDIVNQMKETLSDGYDVVVIDSFVELKEMISDQRDVTKSTASNLITSTMKKYKGGVKKYEQDPVDIDLRYSIPLTGPGIPREDGILDKRRFDGLSSMSDDLIRRLSYIGRSHDYHTHYTSFLVIQQVLKSGRFAGSNSLKHLVSAFLELRFDGAGKSFLKFKKNRRGNVNEKLYYTISEDSFSFDSNRRERDKDAFEWSEEEKERQKEEENVGSISDLLQSRDSEEDAEEDDDSVESEDSTEQPVEETNEEITEESKWDGFNFREDLEVEDVQLYLDAADGRVSTALREMIEEGEAPPSMSRYKLQTFIDENDLDRVRYNNNNR